MAVISPLQALAALKQARFVDLTHAFDGDIPHCESFNSAQCTTLYHYDEGVGTNGSGFLAHEYRHVGQWGTHADPPAHFVRGLRHLDEIPVFEMLLPLAVVDISARAVLDADATCEKLDIEDWERVNGRIPGGAFVALRTGWDRFWPNHELMMNRDNRRIPHFPGWGEEALRFLAEERDVVAIGHDTTDTDPGVVVGAGQAPLEDYWLRQNKWQIELLANLGKVPPSGSVMVATWPKPKSGSGFPARCFAICPEG
ncbi:cyclase family protein [Mesorhizobium sp. ANAO-SY3R2]|uniref:cyclase family protein n=1 Tax=Mesorhizobium sp. ANAO-SY3R2 TaxID=3166644 RepID=UPI003672CAA3